MYILETVLRTVYMLRNLIMQPAAAIAQAPAKYNSISITSIVF